MPHTGPARIRMSRKKTRIFKSSTNSHTFFHANPVFHVKHPIGTHIANENVVPFIGTGCVTRWIRPPIHWHGTCITGCVTPITRWHRTCTIAVYDMARFLHNGVCNPQGCLPTGLETPSIWHGSCNWGTGTTGHSHGVGTPELYLHTCVELRSRVRNLLTSPNHSDLGQHGRENDAFAVDDPFECRPK